MPPTRRTFAFDGTDVFLTYPQCPLERTQLRDFLRVLAPECEYIIGRELHSDGNAHLHAYVHFGGRKRFTSSAVFNLDGYHPNIQRPRRAADVIAYCRKDDTTPLVSDGLDMVTMAGRDGWGAILSESRTRDEFLGLTRERFPKNYVLDYERLVFFCQEHFGRDAAPYSGRTRGEFREPVSLTEWVTENLREVNMCREEWEAVGPNPNRFAPAHH